MISSKKNLDITFTSQKNLFVRIQDGFYFIFETGTLLLGDGKIRDVRLDVKKKKEKKETRGIDDK